MIKDDIQLLFEYDRWANHRVLQAASALRAEQFTRDLGGSFRSVRGHARAHHRWRMGLAYLLERGGSGPAFLKDLWDRHDSLFHPDKFPSITEVKSKWAEVEKEHVEFLNDLTNESLKKMLPIRTTQISLANLMQHLANHSTYHRGQVAQMMRQLDAKPMATDFHLFLLEGQH